MENLKNKWLSLSTLVRIFYILFLLFQLLMVVLNVNAQTLIPARTIQPPGPVIQLNAQQFLVNKVYGSQIGVREKQPNSGREVEAYLRYVNLPKGNPWCAAFVCWVYGQAGIANPRTGWSPDLFRSNKVIWTWAESGKRKTERALRFAYPPSQTSDFRPPTSSLRPENGDVFGLYFPEKNRIAHVGFVDEWKEPWVTTVEGNTNVLGSREGDGVYRKRRLIRSVCKVARYIN